jgi:putative transposase
MSKHIHLHLSPDQRQELEALVRAGSTPARTQTRARILLLTDRSQERHYLGREIAEVLLCSEGTVRNVRRRFHEEGLQAALYDKPRPGAEPTFTGETEAQLTLLACSQPPEGQARWSLRLLANQLIELGHVETISHVTVWELLKKTRSSRGG